MTEAFKWAAGLEKKQNKLENKIQELDDKISKKKKDADKQQQKIDDAKKNIQKCSQQIQEMDPQNPKVRDLQWEIQKYRKEMRDANTLLQIYQKELQNLQNEKEEALKKKEKVTETYNEKVDEESAKKLKEFLWGKFGDEEITRAFLEQKFTKVQEKIQEILGDQDQLAVWKKAMENAKTLEEKQELAIVFEKMQLLAQAHEAEKAELTKQVKAALGHLESSVILSQAYDTADANKLEKKSDFDQKINRTHKEARWARKKIFEQLASKDADMKLKLSFQEKKIMRQFAGIVNDVENWTRAEKKDENLTFTPSVEKVILDYIHSNPEQAARNTDEQWIDMLKAAGLVIKQENRVERRFGARGTTYLKEFAQYYAESFNLDQTQGYTAGKNIRKYFDMVRQSGGFEGMLATYWDAAESSREAFKDKDRAKRLSKRLEKTDPKTDSDLLNLFVDFNLDGTVAHGDSGLKSGLQIHSLYERLAGNDKAEQAKIIDNILAATNKANGLEGDAAITRDTAKSLEQLDKIQTLLKNPPIDVRYILQYGAEATDKFAKERIAQGEELLKEKKAIEKRVDEEMVRIRQEAGKALEEAELLGDVEAIEQLNRFQKIPEQQLREGLREVMEGQVAEFKQSGLGIGVGFPLEKILKGLSFNVATSVDKNGKLNVGINLARNKTIKLTDKLKAFMGASVGTTLGVIPIAGANVGLAQDVTGKKMDQTLSLVSKKTLSTGAHVFASPAILGWGLNLGYDRDLNAGRLEQEKRINKSIKEVIGKLLQTTNEKGEVVQDVSFKLDEAKIKAEMQARYPKGAEKDLKAATDNVIKVLRLYEGTPINTVTMELISEEIAKAYSLAWSNLQVQKLDQKGWYLSGGGLSVTFFAGVIPVVGILKFANHRFAGTADDLSSLEQVKKVMKSDEYNKELEGWVDVNIAALEKQLGVSGIIEAHKTEKDLLVINAKLAESANILLSPAIKGNIKLENGNLLIHKDTPVRALAAHLADRKVATLDIGAQTSAPDAKILNTSTLESLKAEGWFTEDVIDVTKLPIAKAKLSVEKFTIARDELKKQLEKSDFKNSFDLNALTLIPKEDGQFQINYLGQTYDLPAGHHLLIDAKGQIISEPIKNGENFKIILERFKSQTVIHSEVLKIDESLQKTIDKVYTDLSLLTSNGINNVAHKRAGSDLSKLYTQWREELKSMCCYKIGEKVDALYAAAGTMEQLLLKMEGYLLRTDGEAVTGMFGDVLHTIRALKGSSLPSDKVKLQQLLLALDGMFSRTQNVRGTNQEDHYQLVYGNESNESTLKHIVSTNKLRIIQKIEKEKPDCAKAYENLFEAMEQGVDKLGNANAQVEAVRKDGVIAYNFGNPDDLMRPIINPHILKGSEKSEAERAIDPQIKLHTLQNLFDQDSVLVADLMEGLKKELEYSGTVEDLRSSIYKELPWLLAGNDIGSKKGEDGIDFWGKRVKMASEFSTAFFAQCVNQMVMIGGLSFVVEGKTIPNSDPNTPGGWNTPGEWGESTSNTQRFEASIRGSQVALADAESKLRDTNDTQRFGVAATIAKIESDEPEEVIKKNEVETDPNDGSTNDSDNSKENPGDTGPGDGSEWTPIPPKTPDTAPVPWDNPETPDHNIKEEGTPPASPADETDDF